MKKRYTITPNQERRLANFMYGLIPNFELISTESCVWFNSNMGEYEIDIDKWIELTGLEWIQSLNIIFVMELLLKYHLILQTASETIDTGYFDIKTSRSGHNLYVLYQKTTPNFKEELQTLYKQYISAEKDTHTEDYTDIEALIRESSELFNHFRYSFFSEVTDNDKIEPTPNYSHNTPCLLALINALYDLSNLRNLRGITIQNIQETDDKILCIPTQ